MAVASALLEFTSSPRVDWRQECGVVIPCSNESAAIGRVVRSAQVHLPAVIVVDDGSADETARIAAAAGAVVLQHGTRRGKGAALRTGLSWLRENGFNWALLMDGDGQHVAQDIPKFFRKAEASAARMVVGDRMAQADRMPWLRRRVNRWMSARLSRLTGRFLPDSQCGFRLIELGTWGGLDLRTDHFEFESELLKACCAAGAKVEFVPIDVIYRDEQTKISPWKDGWRWMRWYWRAWRGGR